LSLNPKLNLTKLTKEVPPDPRKTITKESKAGPRKHKSRGPADGWPSPAPGWQPKKVQGMSPACRYQLHFVLFCFLLFHHSLLLFVVLSLLNLLPTKVTNTSENPKEYIIERDKN